MKKTGLIIFLLLGSVMISRAQVKKPAKAKAPVHKTLMEKREVKKAGTQAQQRVEVTTEFGVIVLKLYNETPLHRDNFIKLVKQGFYDSLLFHRVIKSFMIQGGDPVSKNADTGAVLGMGDVPYRIPAEFNPKLFHKRGALAAARDNNPKKESSGCQFYIVQGKTYTTKELEQIINGKNLNRKQEVLYQVYQSDTVQAAINALQNSGDKEVVRKYMDGLQTVVDAEFNRRYPNSTKVDPEQIELYINYGGAPHLDGDYTVFGELESGWEVIDKIAAQPVRSSDNRPIKNIRMKMRLLE